MEKIIIVHVLLMFVGWCYGQKDEDCIRTFADLERNVLFNPANKHQISRAYFPLRHEISPVCVTSYYYIGINSSNVDKLSCSTLNVSGGEVTTHGCSKWQWCINSFYMAINLTQLQDLSFHIILDATTEAAIELPPLCNHTNENIYYQHFLRITASVSQEFLIIVMSLCFNL